MIRQGWVLEEQSFYSDETWVAIKVFMNYSDAVKELNILRNNSTREDYQERLRRITVKENDQSIDDFYNQIEQEDPLYQTALTEAINEVKQEIENLTTSNNPYVDSTGKVTDFKKYLRHIFDEAADRNWLSTISICGGDY
jgi:hypothetical protein